MMNLINSTTPFAVAATSFLAGCYGIWLYQGCSAYLPYISFFASGASGSYFNTMFPLVLILGFDLLRRAAVLRQLHAKSIPSSSTRSRCSKHLVKFLNQLFLLLGVVAILGLAVVIYLPWNYNHGTVHFIAAMLGIYSFFAAFFFHLLGTALLWGQENPHSMSTAWASALRTQAALLFSCILLPLILLPLAWGGIPRVSDNYLSAVVYWGIQRAGDTSEDWLKLCQRGTYGFVGWEEMQPLGHVFSFLEWHVFIVICSFLVLSMRGPPVAGEKKKAK